MTSRAWQAYASCRVDPDPWLEPPAAVRPVLQACQQCRVLEECRQFTLENAAAGRWPAGLVQAAVRWPEKMPLTVADVAARLEAASRSAAAGTRT